MSVTSQPVPTAAPPSAPEEELRVSVVVPVYRGERTLPALADEIALLAVRRTTPGGRPFRVIELVLAHDHGPDNSAEVILSLAARHPFVVPVWLSRNFGQHPATLAGMAQTKGDWVVTVDEDGQQNPEDIGKMLDQALETGCALVYAKPANPPPHGALRNFLSRTAKRIVGILVGSRRIPLFNSFRLVSGDIARSLASFCGNDVFLDVGLSWVADPVATCPVFLRPERDRPSGYTFGKLFAYFWRLVVASGTRPLRWIAVLGVLSMGVAAVLAAKAIYEKITQHIPVEGWTSLMVGISFFSGMTLFSLAIIAEYLGLTLSRAMGKPSFLVLSHPPRKPLPRP